MIGPFDVEFVCARCGELLSVPPQSAEAPGATCNHCAQRIGSSGALQEAAGQTLRHPGILDGEHALPGIPTARVRIAAFRVQGR